MNIPKYNLSNFDKDKAAEGRLCVMVPSGYTIGTDPINSMVQDEITHKWSRNPNFMGAGICKYQPPSTYLFTVDSITYNFNEKGRPNSTNALPYKLVMGEAKISLQDVGNNANSTSSSTLTRTNDGDVVATDYGREQEMSIGNMNARDQFAIQAMRGMMQSIIDSKEPRDLSALSDTDINYYCNAAYRWAANMMVASANARAEMIEDARTPGIDIETRMEEIESAALESDTDKLLNNIALALQRTDYEESSSDGIWKKPGKTSLVGPYTNEFVAAHTSDFSDDDHTNVITTEGAIQAGWSWQVIRTYSERIINPTLNSILQEYVRHTPTSQSDTKTKVGLDDLIEAIKSIDSGGGGGGTSGEVDVLSMPSVDIGNNGLGSDVNNPIYISGGGFPSRDVLASAFTKANIHDILTFNALGAVGYSPITEIVSLIDDRIRLWLQNTTVTIDGVDYNLNVPTSI